ncbi:MAG: sigma 54-interacting transcriptional regulator [Desulfobacteraceae bacterium]|nr:sigma 54-interacting transcriptional regulator [Desulfobacteraceae bacterium]MBC2751938.1 sigma 54-interacting transcriptional regulator [Desulfobacteraceae bacterium]
MMKNFEQIMDRILRIRRINIAILLVLMAWLSASALAGASDAEQAEPKRILVIFSYHNGLPWSKIVDDSLRATLASKLTVPFELSVEYADRIRYPSEAYLNNFIDMLRHKYTHPKMDVVIAIGDESTGILLKHGDALFPGTPVVLITAERKTLQHDFLKPNMISLLWDVDIQGNVDLIEELLPKTRHIFILSGSSITDRAAQELVHKELSGYTNRLSIEYLPEMPQKDLMEKVERLPENSVLLYVVFSRDSEGKDFVPREILSAISRKANMPTFGILDTYLGYGIVGGSLLSAESQGRRCGEICLRLIGGESPENFVPEQMANVLMFDERQLKRWKIPEDRLPPGSIVRFATVSFWDLYRWYILAAVMLIMLESGLIAVLLRQQTLRRRAQTDLKQRLHFEKMLSTLSAHFVNLPPDRVESQIAHALKMVAEFLEVDRATIFYLSEVDRKLRSVLSYTNTETGVPAASSQIEFDQFPWMIQKIIDGEMIILADADHLPAGAEAEKNYFQSHGHRSVVVIPLKAGQSTLGMLSLAMLRSRREWPAALIRQLEMVADVFANALMRQKHEESLMQAEKKYRTVADFTYDWEFWVKVDNTMEYVSPSCERVSGYTVQEFKDDPSLFKAIIVPEDRDLWDRHYRDSQRAPKPSTIQFRILRRDGQIRWIEHSCQPVTDDEGNVVGFRASNRDVTFRKLAEIDLRNAYKEISELKAQLEAETAYLQDEIKLELNYGSIIGNSDALKYALFKVEQVTMSDSAVLITGETGTGKELIARAVHNASRYKNRPLVKVDCAALPANLIESELFGYEKGAFSGADARRIGRFELANGTSLFLDEIGELPLELQSKLLRVLQDGEFERLGSNKTIRVKVRIIAATNRPIEAEVRAGRFREDLWYRLNVFPITVPPLRDRVDDILPLAKFFMEKMSRRMGKSLKDIPMSVVKSLQAYPWPGNVRELEHVIERGVINSSGTKLRLMDDLSAPVNKDQPKNFKTLVDNERDHILSILAETQWRVDGPKGAAVILDMHPSTLRSRISKLGIKKP